VARPCDTAPSRARPNRIRSAPPSHQGLSPRATGFSGLSDPRRHGDTSLLVLPRYDEASREDADITGIPAADETAPGSTRGPLHLHNNVILEARGTVVPICIYLGPSETARRSNFAIKPFGPVSKPAWSIGAWAAGLPGRGRSPRRRATWPSALVRVAPRAAL